MFSAIFIVHGPRQHVARLRRRGRGLGHRFRDYPGLQERKPEAFAVEPQQDK